MDSTESPQNNPRSDQIESTDREFKIASNTFFDSLRRLYSVICGFLTSLCGQSRQDEPANGATTEEETDPEDHKPNSDTPEKVSIPAVEEETVDKETSGKPPPGPMPLPPTEITSPDNRTKEVEKKNIPPKNRGGRSRGKSVISLKRFPAVEQTRKPELMCLRQGMNWIVGLAVPEEMFNCEWLISQASSGLEEDDSKPGFWRLPGPLESVEMRERKGNYEYIFPEENFRIFKIVGPLSERGTYMKSLTSGRFLIVAPADWELKIDNRKIKSPIAPEYLVGTQWRAHHVQLPKRAGGPPPCLVTSGGEYMDVPMAGATFDLKGKVIPDAEPNCGPLFCGDSPQLVPLRRADDKTVVVGEEGPGQGSSRWRKYASDFEELRSAIVEKGAGWFFVRLYDSDENLIESLDFRFSSRLQAIEVHDSSPIPGPEGHKSTLIDILHGETIEVTPVDEDVTAALSVRKDKDCKLTQLVIPPLPCYDLTEWLIKESNGGGVKICLRVDRVWWCLRDEQAEYSENRWTDHPLTLKKEDFVATSRQVLCVRLPRVWAANEVYIGIELQRSPKPRSVTGHPHELELPCRELGRFIETELRAQALEFKLWIRSEVNNISDWQEALLARLPMAKGIPPIAPSTLCLEDLDPTRVMQILTRVRHRNREYKKRIDELRWTYYRPIRRRRQRSKAQSEAFVKEALCLLAIIIVDSDALGESPCVPSRWAHRAILARTLCADNIRDYKGTHARRRVYSHTDA